MFTEMKKRKYTLKRRAEHQANTRAKIVAAAVALHEEIGPARTTVSAIAERAGVQRLTVYRHFPDDSEILQACSSSWLEQHPPPDPAGWHAHDEAAARTHAALSGLYAYYRATQGMWCSVYRDVEEVPALAAALRGFEEYLDGIGHDLVEHWYVGSAQRAGIEAVMAHGLRFSTWQSLSAEGLDDEEMAGLVTRWVESLSEGLDLNAGPD
jgi:AcrR family transcriptional regulator